MSLRKKIMILFSSIILFFLIDKELENYGRGYGFFNPNLPYDLNTDYDKYDGFNIEEEGFINVLSEKETIENDEGDSFYVNEILKYGKADKKLFVVALDEQNRNHIIEIIIDENRQRGTQLYFKFYNPKGFKITKLEWFDVSRNNMFLRILKPVFSILHVLIFGLALSTTVSLVKYLLK